MTERFDIFICHAVEDKEQVVRPLAHRLRNAGLTVWYDEFSLRIGDSLRKSIETGISASDFALVVLSPNFFAKQWPQRELDALAAGEVKKGKPRILPIWHDVSASDVQRYSPVLADRLAISTAKGIDYIVDEIRHTVAASPPAGRPKCFVIFPFDKASRKVRETVIAALRDAGVEPVQERSDDSSYEAKGAVFREIQQTDFVVADISSGNPNVFYKLGIAVGMGIPVILITSAETSGKLPSDLAGYHYLVYDPADVTDFLPRLRRVARRYADTRRPRT